MKKKKMPLIIVGLAFSKDVLAVAATASVAVVALAPAIGFDPWTWVLGAAGGTIAQAWLPADKIKSDQEGRLSSVLSWLHGRKMHMLNICASILLAGLGSKYIISLIEFASWPAPSVYFTAFVFSSVWPFLAHVAWKKALKWSES